METMNIFVTDSNPFIASQHLDNIRTSKMITETLQMIGTCFHIHNKWDDSLYKPTHVNHPCNKWTAQSKSNLIWLYNYGCGLYNEYSYRGFTSHKSSFKQLTFLKDKIVSFNMEDKGLSPFVNCTNYKDENDTIQAYRRYLKDKWKDTTITINFGCRDKPEWF